MTTTPVVDEAEALRRRVERLEQRLERKQAELDMVKDSLHDLLAIWNRLHA